MRKKYISLYGTGAITPVDSVTNYIKQNDCITVCLDASHTCVEWWCIGNLLILVALLVIALFGIEGPIGRALS